MPPSIPPTPSHQTSESLLKLQLEMSHVPIVHHNFSFCVLSRKIYGPQCLVMVYTIATTVPLNGIYCRPCPLKDECMSREEVRGEEGHAGRWGRVRGSTDDNCHNRVSIT